MMNNLRSISTIDLMSELARRCVQRCDGPDSILSLLQLVGAMSSLLNAPQRHRIADQRRDLGDVLELKEHAGATMKVARSALRPPTRPFGLRSMPSPHQSWCLSLDRQSDQGTPAKSLGGVYASSEADAVKEAAKEFNVSERCRIGLL